MPRSFPKAVVLGRRHERTTVPTALTLRIDRHHADVTAVAAQLDVSRTYRIAVSLRAGTFPLPAAGGCRPR